MSWWQALLLGLTQGVTEFLPISSSGHLVMVQKLLGFTQAPVAFDIMVHAASLLAILVFFNRRVIQFFKQPRNWLLVFLASLPVGMLGLSLNGLTDRLFNSSTVVAIGWLITAGLLYLTKVIKSKSQARVSLKTGIGVGIFQALALLPGVSRSGSTISAGLYQGLNQKLAFDFSFFLGIPAILAAALIQLPGLTFEQTSGLSLFLGFAAAALSGYFSLRLLERLVKGAKLYWFSYYCLVLGILVLLV